MSTTLHIECDTCKKSLWVGQRSHGRSYIYKTPEEVESFDRFLLKHMTTSAEDHRLFFRSSVVSKAMDGQSNWEREDL